MKRQVIIAFLMLPGSASFGQLLTNDNVAITVTGGAQLTAKGDVLNKTGTTINNNGTIDLTGNWVNNSGNNCFGTSQGTVILNGAAQSIGGVSSTDFNNLTLQGSGTKTLLINTTAGGAYAVPAGILNVGNVVLDVNSSTLFISNPSTGAVSYGTGNILSEDVDNSSKVSWTINTTTGVHTIPFGNAAGVQIPFSFNLASGDAGVVTVSTYATAPNNQPYPVAPVVVTHVRNIFGTDNSANTVDRFWQVNPTGNPVAALTFTYAVAENAANGNSNMRAQRWMPPQDAWEAPLSGQVNPTSQSVLVNNVTSFGPWAIATESSPLPVQLLEFTATPDKNKRVICRWVTATEINNDYFTVMRSKNGIDFEVIGTVDGAGNSTSLLSYSFVDENPYTGISYYKLRQTDFNGDFTFSQTVAVHIFTGSADVNVFPNPSNGIFFIAKNDPDNPVQIMIYDMKGRLIKQDTFYDSYNQVDITGFGKGVYNLQTVYGDLGKNFRVVIQ